MPTESRDNEAPIPLAPLLARVLGDSRIRGEMLSAALALLREREQDYQKLHTRYIALLEQYRAARRASADVQSLRAATGSREAA